MNRASVNVAIYAGTAAGVFWLPFHVPPFTVMPSMAQAFHFNNQVAVAALLCGVALAACWNWAGNLERIDSMATPDPAASRPLGWRPLLAMLAVSSVELTLACLGSAWYPWGGGAYFVNRLCMMLGGSVPYRDLEFSYGPAMLYVPVALLRWMGLSTLAAYLSTLWAFTWIGLLLLWWVIRQSRAGGRCQTVTFLLLAAFPALNAEWGLQYTLTRYICGFAALLMARIAVDRLKGRWFLVALCHLLLTAAVFSISPEVALAFWAALAAYWFLEYRAGSRWFVYVAAMQIGLMACLATFAPRSAFLSVRVFSAGGSAWPLFPSPYMLLYVGSLLAVIAPVLGNALRTQGRDRGAFGTLTPVFAVHALAMIPAALGRADPEHVFYNGIGVFLLALLAPSAVPRRWDLQWVYRGAFVLIFPVLAITVCPGEDLLGMVRLAKPRIVEWMETHPSSELADLARKAMGEAEYQRQYNILLLHRQSSLERWVGDLRPYGKICVPFGDPDVFYVLSQHQALQSEYYYALTVESPAAEVRRKLEDVRSCAYAILPGRVLAGSPRVVGVDLSYASRLLMFPLRGSPPVPAPAPATEFTDYVRASFVPLRQVTPTQFLCAKRP